MCHEEYRRANTDQHAPLLASRARVDRKRTVRQVRRGIQSPLDAWPRLASLAGIAVMASAVAGCGAPGEAEEASGTTFTVLYDADERIFGPYWSVDAWFLMFLPLATWDESGEAIGRLVRSWEHSRDYRT